MLGYRTSVADQFSGNAISGTMVLSMMAMMVLMVIDRYFYSAAKEQQRKDLESRLHTDEPIIDETMSESVTNYDKTI